MGTEIIIIGEVTAGTSVVSKITGGSRAEVVVYKRGAICSCETYELPYYLASREADIQQAVAAMEGTSRTPGVTTHCRHEVLSVACDRKQVAVRNPDNGQVFDDHYDKPVIAASSHNLIPDVSGVEKVDVQVLKTVEGVILLRGFTETPFVRDITIIGSSFAGLEPVGAFLKMDHSARTVEKEDQLLSTFDREVSAMVQQELEKNSVRTHLRETLRGFIGGTFIEKTETSRGSYDTDLAMMVVGAAPSTGCLTGPGISTTPQGEIIVNKSMETDVPDVYAVGDYTRSLEGSLRTSSLEMADLETARTGFTGQEAKEQDGMGSRVRTALVTTNDRPGLCPSANQITIKMVYDGVSDRILDAQAWGKKNVIARISMFAVATESGMTPGQLGNIDFSYSSAVSPIWDPVQAARHGAR